MNGLFFLLQRELFSWEPPFNVAYLNSIYPDFLYKQNERNGILDADDGRVGYRIQNSSIS